MSSYITVFTGYIRNVKSHLNPFLFYICKWFAKRRCDLHGKCSLQWTHRDVLSKGLWCCGAM